MSGSSPADLRPRSWRQLRRRAPFLTDQHLRRILEGAVAPTFAVTQAGLWATTRGGPSEASARQVAMYLAHVGYGLSFSEIGRLFRRNRKTVAHACAVVEDRREEARFDRALDLLEGAVRLLSPGRA